MKNTPPHLQALEEVEQADISGLLEVLREEGMGTAYATLSGTYRDGIGTTPLPPGEAEPPKSRSARAWRWRCGWRRLSPRSWTRPTNGRPRKSWTPSKRGRRACIGSLLADSGHF